MTAIVQSDDGSPLALYEAARTAIAAAESTDELLLIKDKTVAMRCAAQLAKDTTLEVYAVNIRHRAERRLGEMIIAQKEGPGLNRGAAGSGANQHSSSAQKEVRSSATTAPPTLADAGIAKDLSARAQKLAAIPEEQFEAALIEHERAVVNEGKKVSARLDALGIAAATGRVPSTESPTRIATLERQIKKFRRELDERTAELEAEREAHTQIKADLQRLASGAVEQDETIVALQAFRDNEHVLLISKLQERLRIVEADRDTGNRQREVMVVEIKRLQKTEAKYLKLVGTRAASTASAGRTRPTAVEMN